MDDVFYLDGECCEDHGIKLQRAVSFSGPARKIETISIPGRNGDLHISDGSYENITGIASCYALQECVHRTVEEIANWLSGVGYRKLVVSDDPGCYRLARIVASPAREFRVRRLAPFEIEFDCDPRRFLMDGEYPITISSTPGSVYNPTSQTSTPLIRVYGTAAGTLTVGETPVEIKELTDQIVLDCDTQNAYRQPGEGGMENKNKVIYAPVFPTLKPGRNGVSWTGGITKVEITPRWWTL